MCGVHLQMGERNLTNGAERGLILMPTDGIRVKETLAGRLMVLNKDALTRNRLCFGCDSERAPRHRRG